MEYVLAVQLMNDPPAEQEEGSVLNLVEIMVKYSLSIITAASSPLQFFIWYFLLYVGNHGVLDLHGKTLQINIFLYIWKLYAVACQCLYKSAQTN